MKNIAAAANTSYERVYETAMSFYRQNKKGDLETAKLLNVPLTQWHGEDERLYADARSCLEALSMRYKIGIIANQLSGTRQRLAQHGILPYIDLVVASAEEGVSKPDKRIFEIALERSSCNPGQAVMIGDRVDNDVLRNPEVLTSVLACVWSLACARFYYYTNEFGEQTSSCYLCNRDIGKYIVSSNYADEALGDFLTYIKESDKFNNTVFVFYGDHDAKMSYKDMNYLYNYDYLTGELKTENDDTFIDYDSYDHQLNKKTPLIIWTKNKSLSKKLKGKVDTIMGMYDAAPTLYNMLDIDNEYVLGHDIFNIKDENIVIYPNGNYLTDKVYYNNSTGEYKILKEDIILESDYVSSKLEYAENTLEVGNIIIMYDLFNQKRETDYNEE